MPHPKNDSDPPRKSRRRHSHFRKKSKDDTTTLVRAPRSDVHELQRALKSDPVREELWMGVSNDAPNLPDPPLHRPLPPPAPLPVEPPEGEVPPYTWTEEQQRLKRVEDVVGMLGLAILVAAMLIAMWLRMTGD